jgi:hypothetical protein
MRKFLIPAILLGATVIATPASAQYGRQQGGYGQGYGYGQGQNVQREIQQLRARIDRAYQRGAISPNEARRLSNELRRIESRFEQGRRNGISPRERQDLQRRLQNLRQNIREERMDGRGDRDRRW